MQQDPNVGKVGVRAEDLIAGETPPNPPPNATTSRVVMSLTPREAVDLLVKLASEDGFRDELQSSPEEVLARFHIYLPPGSLPKIVRLPSKEKLQSILKSMCLHEPFVLTLASYKAPTCPPPPPFMVALPLVALLTSE